MPAIVGHHHPSSDHTLSALCDDVDPRRIPRLLAIEQSPLVQRLLRARLRSERLEIFGAARGNDGLVLARLLRPNVIVLDLTVPQAGGIEVLRELKGSPETHDIPVIMVSGEGNPRDKVRCFDMGAIDFITKPFDTAEFGARVRSALRLHLMIRMLAQRAQIDALTGLWNRAYFDNRIRAEWALAERHGRPLSLILCDLDHFKQINDRYGHPVGDLVLEEFARLLAGGRSSDIPCRYGGEEFAIIVPSSCCGQAAEIAERLRLEVRDLTWQGEPDLLVTCSFGVVDRPSLASPSPVALVTAADEALYEAKRLGRDRVVTADGSRRACA